MGFTVAQEEMMIIVITTGRAVQWSRTRDGVRGFVVLLSRYWNDVI